MSGSCSRISRDKCSAGCRFNEITTAFEEDKQILEAQQRSIELFAGPSSVNIPADAGGIQARRLLRTLIETQLAPA
ncbi:hypothetical protein [Bradyrhizobium liaoningense]